jgi:DNA-binding winged helix-turn-helix (wHTH) protein/TolB-like protein
MDVQERDVYEFAGFRFVPDERLLTRDGNPVRLTDKCVDLLALFVRNGGHLLAKDELIGALWPDTFVEENNLTKHVSMLRKVLDEGGPGGRYIETVPKRGFRFVADVRRLHEPVAHPEHTPASPVPVHAEGRLAAGSAWPPAGLARRASIRRAALAGAVVLAALAGAGLWAATLRPAREAAARAAPRSIAVLPFRTTGVEADAAYLGVGIADALITKLSTIREVAVRPTSAVLKYADDGQDAVTAGHALMVDSVLEGSLTRSGDRIRVRVQLIDVADGTTLWAETFDDSYQNLFAVEESMAERVSAAFQIQATADATARMYKRYTENVEAYALYSEGRVHVLRYTKTDALAAVGAFERALALDPDYALAHAGLALACALVRSRIAGEAEIRAWEERAKHEAALALALEPELAEAHEALSAVYRYTEFDWDETIKESSLALALNPNLDLPHYHRAAAYYHLGLFDLAERDALAGLEANPVARFEPLRLRGMSAYFDGRYAQAVVLLEEAKQVSGGTVADWHLAQAYFYAGERTRAEELLAALCLSPQVEDRARAQAVLASFLAARGERGPAGELLAAVTGGPYVDHHVAYSVGAAYAQLGEAGRATRWLTRATETGLRCYPWYERDPLLHPLAADPEFMKLKAELRRSWDTARSRYGGVGY